MNLVLSPTTYLTRTVLSGIELARKAEAQIIRLLVPAALLLAASGLTAGAFYVVLGQTVASLGKTVQFYDFYRVGENPWADALSQSIRFQGKWPHSPPE